MKRLLASISLVAVTTTAASAVAAPVAKPTAKPFAHARANVPLLVRVAPADEYFGKLKMSVLGIRNTIKDVGANLDIDQTRWQQLASKAAFAEDAMRDWEKKYPQDTWLAKMIFALERMYAKLDSDEGRTHALASMHWLVRDFSKSWYGRTGKKELALGKVGQRSQTASAPATPSPDPEVVTAPVATPAAGTTFTSTGGSAISPDQASGGVAATPVPNPLPSITPGEHPEDRPKI